MQTEQELENRLTAAENKIAALENAVSNSGDVATLSDDDKAALVRVRDFFAIPTASPAEAAAAQQEAKTAAVQPQIQTANAPLNQA